MYVKVAICLTFAILLLISCSIYVGTIDAKSYFFPLLQPPPLRLSLCATDRPLRVYMYDLPRKFNAGMMDRGTSQVAAPATVENFPPWPKSSGLKRQHSVEYWLMASLLYDEEEGSEAIRVSDPEMADAFFVPFFSSLSFNKHGHVKTDAEADADRQLQVLIMLIGRRNAYLAV
ncbi:hypothetical protein Golob_005937, partial [Gossypium lobatum]|nr:hypothetical protein [Gossypium lobatum]